MKIITENSDLVLKKNWNNKKTNNDIIKQNTSILKSINSADYYKRFKKLGNFLKDNSIFSIIILQNKNIYCYWNIIICFKKFFIFFSKFHKRKSFIFSGLQGFSSYIRKNKFLEYYFFVIQKCKLLFNKLYVQRTTNLFGEKKNFKININFSLIYLLKIKKNCNLINRIYRNTCNIYKSSNFLSEVTRNFLIKKIRILLIFLFFYVNIKFQIFRLTKRSIKIIKYYKYCFEFRWISKMLIKYLFKFINNN
jgi:hypothetical protein